MRFVRESVLGHIGVIRTAAKCAGSDVQVRRAAHRLGEHDAQALRERPGDDDARTVALRARVCCASTAGRRPTARGAQVGTSPRSAVSITG
jgi:hypothetical protein